MKGKSSAAVVTAVCVLSAICAAGLYFSRHGITLFAKVDDSTDNRFSADDMDTAIRLAKTEFRAQYDGCILKTIGYDADADAYPAAQSDALVLYSEYLRVTPFADSGFGSGQTYCRWVFQKNSSGIWELEVYG